MTCGINTSCAELLLQILVIGLSNGAVIALNAIGVTLVYGVSSKLYQSGAYRHKCRLGSVGDAEF